MAVRKWSVSIDESLAAQVEEHVGNRGLSSFVARAVGHELEKEKLAKFLDELDLKHGAIPEELIERFDAQWPS